MVLKAALGHGYRALAGQDSTNGRSWCGYTYFNSDPIFAVVVTINSKVLSTSIDQSVAYSLKAMGGKTYNSDPAGWRAATQKYRGLEATVKDPKSGKQMLIYIGDSFYDKYVLVGGPVTPPK